MNRQSIVRFLEDEGIQAGAYSLHPSPKRDEAYRLEPADGAWVVYYSERDLSTGVWQFDTEDEACSALLELLLRDSTTRES